MSNTFFKPVAKTTINYYSEMDAEAANDINEYFTQELPKLEINFDKKVDKKIKAKVKKKIKNTTCLPSQQNDMDIYVANEVKEAKLKSFKSNKLENVHIIYQTEPKETFDIDVHDIKKILPDGENNKFTYDSNGFSYDSKEKIFVNSYVDLVQHMQPENKIIYSTAIERVFLDGDKLVIGKYFKYKEKRVGIKYFKQSSVNSSITLNLKTGSFYNVSTIWKASKISNKTIKKNDFHNIFSSENNIFEKLSDETKKQFCEFLYEKLYDYTDGWVGQLNPAFVIKTWFTRFHKIKIDDYDDNFVNYYPGLKEIKKYKGNFNTAVLQKYDIGNYNGLETFLSENPNIDFFKLKTLISIFDGELLNNIDWSKIKLLLDIDNKEKCNKNFFNTNSGFKLEDGKELTHFEYLQGTLPSLLTPLEKKQLYYNIVPNLKINLSDLLNFTKNRKNIQDKLKINFLSIKNKDEIKLVDKICKEIKYTIDETKLDKYRKWITLYKNNKVNYVPKD